MFFRRKRTQQSPNRPARRRLFLERLLNRELLAADFGAISGTLFTDLSGDGLSVGDPIHAGVAVTLYQDGGDGIFDFGGAGSDDLFVQATTSNGSGVYLFDRLEAGLYFVEQDPIAGRIQRTGESVAEVEITAAMARGINNTGQVTIDTFDGNLQEVADPAVGPILTTSSATATEALGGERDIRVTRVSGAGSVGMTINGSDGAFLIFESSPTGFGTGEVQWDGADGNATSVNHTGLGGVNLLAGGAEGFLVDVGASEPGSTFALTFFTNATDFSTYTITLPTSLPALTAFTIPFDDAAFVDGGAGANFSNIGAIRGVLTTTVGATDVIVDVVGAIAPNTATANFANFIPLTLGNLVYQDLNNNGQRDVGDTGINGVTVSLFTDTNSNGTFEPGTDLQVGTSTVTAGGGLYQFTGLFPGNYFVQIPQSQFALGNALAGFQTSLHTTTAPDPDNDVDNDDNGTAISGQGVVSGAITLVSLSEPTSDSDTDNNTNLTLDFGFTPQVDVQIVKSVLTNSPVVGQAATYRLTVTNNTTRSVSNVVVTDTLPAGVTNPQVNMGQGTSSIVGQTITGTIGTMTAGQVVIIDITVNVPAAGTGAFNNVASVTSDGFDTVPANNSSNVDLNPARIVDISLDKTASVATAFVGNEFFYTITLINEGPSTATGVTITDTLPTGITFDDGIISRGGVNSTSGFTVAGNQVTVNVGAMNVSEVITVTLNVTAGASAVGNSINSATVAAVETDNDPSNNTDTASVAVTAVVDLVIDKTSPTSVIAGQTLTYTFNVSNNGPANATGVTIVDTLPAGVTFASGTGGTFYATTPGQVSIAVGNLSSGASTTLTLTVNVPASATGTLTNTAVVSAAQTELPATNANNTDTVLTAVTASVDLSITKTDSVDPVVPGNQLIYTITVDNLGSSNATNAFIEDVLPAGVSLVSVTENGTNITNSVTVNGQIVTIPVGTIAPSDPVRVFTVTTNVAASVTATLSNTVTVRSSQQASEVSLTNNEAVQTTAVNPTAVLTITKNDNVTSATPGSTLTYTIQVSNAGPSNASNVVVTDALPAGVTFANGSAPGGTISQTGSSLSIPFGTVAAGSSATASVTINIGTATRGTLTNSVNVTGTGVTAGTLTATENTPLVPSFDITVAQTVAIGTGTPSGSVQAIANDLLNFTIVVSNAATSPSAATGVTLTNVLPSGVTFQSGSGPNGAITSLTNIPVGTLEPGATATFTVTGRVNSNVTVGSALSNSATVAASDEPTTAPLTNTSATTINIVAANSAISGRVIIDENMNGVLDSGEAGLSGATITLVNVGTGATVATVTTDSNGNYQFTSLPAGTYRVTRTLPDGFSDGPDATGSGAIAGSVLDTSSFQVQVGAGGSTAVNFNFGAVRPELSNWLLCG